MSIITTLSNQKHHLIYSAIILIIASIAYHFFKKNPEKITTTLTKVVNKIQTVEKVVTKDRIVYVDRTITTHKANGDVIVETDHEHDNIVSHSDTNTTQKVSESIAKSTVTSFMKNYSIETMFPITVTNPTSISNPLDTSVSLGTRIFSTPVWAVIGSDFHFNKVQVGLRLEF